MFCFQGERAREGQSLVLITFLKQKAQSHATRHPQDSPKEHILAENDHKTRGEPKQDSDVTENTLGYRRS